MTTSWLSCTSIHWMSAGVPCMFVCVILADVWLQPGELVGAFPPWQIFPCAHPVGVWNTLLIFKESLDSLLLTFVVLQIFKYGSFVGSKCLEFLVKSSLSTISPPPLYGLDFVVISKIYLPGPRSGDSMSISNSFGSLMLHSDTSLSYFILILFWRPRFAM